MTRAAALAAALVLAAPAAANSPRLRYYDAWGDAAGVCIVHAFNDYPGAGLVNCHVAIYRTGPRRFVGHVDTWTRRRPRHIRTPVEVVRRQTRPGHWATRTYEGDPAPVPLWRW